MLRDEYRIRQATRAEAESIQDLAHQLGIDVDGFSSVVVLPPPARKRKKRSQPHQTVRSNFRQKICSRTPPEPLMWLPYSKQHIRHRVGKMHYETFLKWSPNIDAMEYWYNDNNTSLVSRQNINSSTFDVGSYFYADGTNTKVITMRGNTRGGIRVQCG